MVYQNPSTWSKHLVWVEYAHNSSPTSATGLSPFHCALGNQPPLFPDDEMEVSVPSAHAMVQRCRRIWAATRKVLIRQGDRVKKMADRKRRLTPNYCPGQSVAVSQRSTSQGHLQEVGSTVRGSFPVTRLVGPAAIRHRLSWSLRVHPTFHVN